MTQDPVKNLVSNTDIYEKHQSFQNLGIKKDSFELVLKNLAHAEQNIPKEFSDYRKEILGRAFKDLNNPESESSLFKLSPNVIAELGRIELNDYPRYLFYRYRYDVFPKTYELDEFPPCLQIEPTSICNFRCVFCYQTDQEFTDTKGAHMGSMSFDLFKKIIDEVEGEVEAITLASRGEPFIAPDFSKMLAYLPGKFLGVKINTNASLLNEKRCHDILASGAQTLVFSADSADEELYSKLRVNGTLKKTLKNVELFNKIKDRDYKSSKLITRVSGVKVNTDQKIEDMEDFWGDLVEQVAFVNYNPWENTYERSESEVTTPCSDLWRRSFVWFDGLMNPCDVDYKSYLQTGNAKEKSIQDLWNSPAYNHMRGKHRDGKRSELDPCKKCTVV